MSIIPEIDEKVRRALTSQDTLLKYKKPKLILPEKKEIVPHYSHITGMTSVLEKDKPKTTEEILDNIFPPRFYEKDGKAYIQKISREPAYHWDVIELHQCLNDRLKEHGAEEIFVGLCPIRRWLFDQCSDEVVRQVTVNMGERGLLLKRIKDDLRVTLESYHRLYLSATKYAVRKSLIIANQQFEMEKTIKRLTQIKEAEETNIAGLLADEEREEREDAEMRETMEKEHATECFLLRKKCRALEAQIRTRQIAINLSKKAKKKVDVKKYKYKLFKS